jgi:hypothetical protein
MAASIKRTIRKTLMEIIQETTATPAERLEARTLLWKDLASAQKGKPRGRPFQKKNRDARDRLLELVRADD